MHGLPSSARGGKSGGSAPFEWMIDRDESRQSDRNLQGAPNPFAPAHGSGEGNTDHGRRQFVTTLAAVRPGHERDEGDINPDGRHRSVKGLSRKVALPHGTYGGAARARMMGCSI